MSSIKKLLTLECLCFKMRLGKLQILSQENVNERNSKGFQKIIQLIDVSQ